MSELLHLSSPDGEPFEVIPALAGKLLADGWSFTAPVVVESEPAPADAPVEARDPVVDAEVQSNSQPVTEDAALPIGALAYGTDDETVENQADPTPRKRFPRS